MKNRPNINFAIEKASLIQGYCHDLFKQTSLHSFAFHRVFRTGVMASLVTHTTWHHHFLSHGYSRHIERRLNEGIHLWSSLGSHLSKMTLEAQMFFNLAHPVDIVFEHANFYDIFNFATVTGNDAILEFYLNHRVSLDSFCYYFYSVAKPLIETASSERHLFCLESFNRKSLTSRLKLTLPEFTIRDFSLPQLDLTLRETQTAMLYLRGRSWNEIASELRIQARTAQSYFNEVKYKLGVTTRTEFFDRAYQLGLHTLPIDNILGVRTST